MSSPLQFTSYCYYNQLTHLLFFFYERSIKKMLSFLKAFLTPKQELANANGRWDPKGSVCFWKWDPVG